MIFPFAVRFPICCATRLICHSLCLIPLNNKMFQFLIFPQGFNRFYSHFVNGCMLICNWNMQKHKCFKCSFWLLLITHHRPTNIIFINNIHYIRPSLWRFGVPRYGHYNVIATSDGSGYHFKAHFCRISKDVIDTCWWFHSCTVCNYTGRLTDKWTCTRLQVLVAVLSFFLSGQLDETQSIYLSVYITYIIKHFTHVIQIMTVSTWPYIAASNLNGLLVRQMNL